MTNSCCKQILPGKMPMSKPRDEKGDKLLLAGWTNGLRNILEIVNEREPGSEVCLVAAWAMCGNSALYDCGPF
jgi:hypothetical protein